MIRGRIRNLRAHQPSWLRVSTLLVVTFFMAACVGMGGGSPEDAARDGMTEWAERTAATHRNLTITVLSEEQGVATVDIKAEFQTVPGGSWIEEHAVVQIRKDGGKWQPPTDLGFSPTEQTLATAETNRNATATTETEHANATSTAETERADATSTAVTLAQQASATASSQAAEATASVEQATASAETAIRDATATAEAVSQQATAEAKEIERQVTATARGESEQATATAVAENRQATATAEAERRAEAEAARQAQLAAANAEFDGEGLPDGWRVLRPDPAKWAVVDGVLRLYPSSSISRWSYNNEFVRPLPSLDENIDIVVRLWAYPTQVNNQYFSISLRVGESLCPTSVWIGVGLGSGGPYVSSERTTSCNSYGRDERSVSYLLDEAIYLKFERRQGGNYIAYVSNDGQSWTFVNEFTDIAAFDTIAISGWTSGNNNDFYAEVDWIHFEIPD